MHNAEIFEMRNNRVSSKAQVFRKQDFLKVRVCWNQQFLFLSFFVSDLADHTTGTWHGKNSYRE